MIWIRADANSEIGTGHVMRCLSVAKEMQQRGNEVCFILADDFPVKMLQDRKMNYKVLHTRYERPEEELPVLCQWLEQEKPQLLLVDSYFVSKEYLEQIAGYTKVAYMDDFCHTEYPVDVLVNYNIYGDMLPYRDNMAKEDVELLLGTKYVPLREEFRNTEYTLRKTAEHVLITTGGSDKYNLAGLIVEKAMKNKELCGLQYHVISGMFNQNLSFLRELEEKYPNVHIHQNVTDMAELMKQCDVAITAGGSTMYELCAVGVPMIAFSFVENQKRQVETFAKRELVSFGGDYESQRETMMDEVMIYLKKLAGSFEERKKYSERGKAIVDGHGAGRIAEKLIKTK